MEDLKVTIITVTYNCEDTIEDTINSVIGQTYKNIEMIIVDGKSQDRTVEIIKKYVSLDNRIKYISEKDNGIYEAMNKGIKISSGDIMNFLNSADKYMNFNVISNIVNKFIIEKETDILYSNILAGGSEIIYKSRLNDLTFVRRKSVCHQAMFIKKEVFNFTGLYNENLKITADREWFIKCYKSKMKIKHFAETCVFFDTNGISSNGSRNKIIEDEMEEIIYRELGLMLLCAFKLLNIKHRVMRRARCQ